jgi:hypothetical protein
MNWFEYKVSYDKMKENGCMEKATELYLVSEPSFTEAEARIVKEMRPYISGDFTVQDIKRMCYSEVFTDNVGFTYYFKAKINLVGMDEKSGTEKKTAVQVLVQAANIKGALNRIEEGMKGTLSDYWIVSVSEIMILDVFS